jgi:hypothetical protein
LSTDTVQLVDEDQTGNFGVVRVAPVGFGLGLNAAGTTEYADTAVEYFQRTIHFYGEVNVAGGVDDVEAVAFPEAADSSGLNGNTALGFLFHEVGGGLTLVYFTQLVDTAGEFEDTFSCSGFTGINVGEDTNIAVEG